MNQRGHASLMNTAEQGPTQATLFGRIVSHVRQANEATHRHTMRPDERLRGQRNQRGLTPLMLQGDAAAGVEPARDSPYATHSGIRSRKACMRAALRVAPGRLGSGVTC